MDAAEFVKIWQKAELTERSAAEQHYLNLCEVFDHHGHRALISYIGKM